MSAALSSAIRRRNDAGTSGDVPGSTLWFRAAVRLQPKLLKLGQELVKAILDADHVHALEVPLGYLKPSRIHIEHIHVGLRIVLRCQGKKLRLVVLDEAAE